MRDLTVTYPVYPDAEVESRFTKANSFCEHPSRWHSADTDSTEYEVLELVAAMVRALQPEIVVETGSAFGYGAFRIGQALRANGHGKLYSLEIDTERCKALEGKFIDLPVEIINQSSLDWTPPGEIGFAFFDSFPELRAKEFRRFLPWFGPASIVAFHDCAPHHNVYPTVQRLEAEGLLKGIRLHTPRGIVLAEVL